MRENLQRALAEVFGHEGGFTNDKRDPGNWTGGKVGAGRLLGTKYGIAANSYPHLDIPRLTLAQAAEIYARDYWGPAGCDRLFAGVDLAAFDLAVNSGVGRVRQLLPKAVGSENHAETVKRLCALRLSFMRSLKVWSTYSKGWSRRVARIEAVGVAWALAAMGASKGTMAAKVEAERAGADKTASRQEKVAGTAGTAGAGSGAGATVPPEQAPDTLPDGVELWPVLAVLAVVLIGIALFFWWKGSHNRERARAYAALNEELIGGQA
ncbi:MAG TPA: glycosyl hydrolase 108 family protein [Microvirga sp.]|jgi:lysozyme family protein|nr:glycosyl hydrolase 108 family protein [Microvirga sp.]